MDCLFGQHITNYAIVADIGVFVGSAAGISEIVV
jgi:hypothetical protein